MTAQLQPDAPGVDPAAVHKLDESVQGPVFSAFDDGYDEERIRYQTFRPHAPTLVVGAENAQDVQRAVEFAARHDLPIGVQASGHSPARPATTGVLISTRRMNQVRIDPAARTARLGAGVVWQQVVEAAVPHGLVPLSGSAPHVGAIAYTLGGGLGLLARRYGYAADHVRRIEAVTTDGRLREIDAQQHRDLFWALRGGRDNFGVVTSMDVALVPLRQLFGGALYFDGARAQEILTTWLDWTTALPEEMTSSIALVPLPDVPALPPPLRGRYVANIRIAFLGEAEDGERLIAPLRALGPPLADSVRVLPYTESASIHNDPVPPAAYSGTNAMLSGLDEDTVHRVLSMTGPQAPITSIVEVRHLGGALSRAPQPPNSVGNREAAYLLAVLNRVTPDSAEPVRSAHTRLLSVLAPSTIGRSLNFLYGAHATPEQVAMAYSPGDYRQLRHLKATWDPRNLLRLNHNIPPADEPR